MSIEQKMNRLKLSPQSVSPPQPCTQPNQPLQPLQSLQPQQPPQSLQEPQPGLWFYIPPQPALPLQPPQATWPYQPAQPPQPSWSLAPQPPWPQPSEQPVRASRQRGRRQRRRGRRHNPNTRLRETVNNFYGPIFMPNDRFPVQMPIEPPPFYRRRVWDWESY